MFHFIKAKMAGRGRQSTLPAWMSSTEGGGEPPIVSNSDTFADAPTNRPEGDTRPDAEQERRSMIDGRKPRSRSRDRGDRDRGGRDGRGDRDSHRDRGRDRDRDDRGGRGSDGRREPPPREPSPPAWQPKPNRQSNFDVVGPGGEELPGVGVGILSTGVGLVRSYHYYLNFFSLLISHHRLGTFLPLLSKLLFTP